MSVKWVLRCRDCGERFTSADRHVVMCLNCLFALMAEDDPDNDPRSEYAESIADLPLPERRRLAIGAKWVAPSDAE